MQTKEIYRHLINLTDTNKNEMYSKSKDYQTISQELGYQYQVSFVSSYSAGQTTDTIISAEAGYRIKVLSSDIQINFPEYFLEAYIDPGYNGGTPLTNAFNLNRNFADDPQLTVIAGVTVTATGTLFLTRKIFAQEVIGGRTTGAYSAQPALLNACVTMNPDEQILFRVQNSSSQDGEVSVILYWIQEAI